MLFRATRVCALIAGFIGLCAGSASAAFPERTINIVVPYSAGGPIDISARIISDYLSKHFNVPVIVTNRPGASGMVGGGQVARSPGDGYTWLFSGDSIAMAPSQANVSFDLLKDLTPVSKVVYGQYSILVNPALPVKDLKELIAYARANPGKLLVASPGLMTSGHFALEDFRQNAGIDFKIVQYSGNSPANTSTLSGVTSAGLGADSTAKEFVSSGMLRALAVTSANRSPSMPDVPTVSEAAIPGYESTFSAVVLAPSSTPKPIVDMFSKAVAEALKDPTVLMKVREQGYEPVGSTPEEYATQLKTDVERNARIIQTLKASGVVQ